MENKHTYLICQNCGYRVKADSVYTMPSACPLCDRKLPLYEKLKRRYLKCDDCDECTEEVLVEDENNLPSAGRCQHGGFFHWENYEWDIEFKEQVQQEEAEREAIKESGADIRKLGTSKRKSLRQRRRGKSKTINDLSQGHLYQQ